MKTWEMMKELTNNKNLKFTCVRQPGNPISIINNILCWERSGNPVEFNFESPNKVGTIERYEWEPVREPVDFMTAINSDKKIRPHDYPNFCSVNCWFNLGLITKDRINNKWYVE